jgi:hypothetical protein
MITSSRQTNPSDLGKILIHTSDNVRARLKSLLEMPVILRLPTPYLNNTELTIADLVTMQLFVCMGQVEAIMPLWSLKHLELFKTALGTAL